MTEEELQEMLFGSGSSHITAKHDDLSEKLGSSEKKHASEAVWHDVDDDELVVQLDSAPRLKKLKKTNDSTEITGTELSQRLRSRFILTLIFYWCHD